jgi:type IV secretion system protein VirD4
MSSNIALIMRSGFAPIKAKQFIWYKEDLMKNWVNPTAFVPKQKAKQMPFIRKRTESNSISTFDCID